MLMISEVLNCPLEGFGSLPVMHDEVAGVAEQCTDISAIVAVVDREWVFVPPRFRLHGFSGVLIANSAAVALSSAHSCIVFGCDTVASTEVVTFPFLWVVSCPSGFAFSVRLFVVVVLT